MGEIENWMLEKIEHDIEKLLHKIANNDFVMDNVVLEMNYWKKQLVHINEIFRLENRIKDLERKHL